MDMGTDTYMAVNADMDTDIGADIDAHRENIDIGLYIKYRYRLYIISGHKPPGML